MDKVIDYIHDLNDLINENHDYISKIISDDKNNHKYNFMKLNKIILLYNSIIEIYEVNYENNQYIFKCIFDITIKYLSNIAGFYVYLNLLFKFKNKELDDKDIDDIYNKISKKIGFEKQNYTSLLDILETTEILTISNIKHIEIIITPLELTISLSHNNLNNSKIINLMLYLKNCIFETIQKIIDLDTKTNEHNSNFITIPQNATMCVFISMLTGICYSDLNKSLINQKKIEKSYKDNSFLKLVESIIEKITNNHRRYDDYDDCELLEFLKKEPFNVLNNITIDIFTKIFISNYKEYTQKTSLDIIISNNNIKISKKIYHDFIQYLDNYYLYSKYSYFVDLMNKNFKDKEDYFELEYDFENDYRMRATDMRVLIYFYELLNIKAKHIFIKDDIYLEYNNKHVESTNNYNNISDPDVLILQNFKINTEEMYMITDIIGDLKIDNNELGIITFNDIKYKLDYILHMNNIEKCKNKKCYHCISAITYNNDDYIYNSGIISDIIKCENGEEYFIPCSLIKQKWNKNINKEITYCTTNCKYNLDCNIDNLYNNNACYTFNTNIIYIYVKVE
jgi:hypothetical protein